MTCYRNINEISYEYIGFHLRQYAYAINCKFYSGKKGNFQEKPFTRTLKSLVAFRN